MPKGAGKKNGPLAKPLLTEENCATTPFVPPNIQQQTSAGENDVSASGKSKKKKKKKKKCQSGDMDSIEVNDDNQTPDAGVPTDLENLSKLSELTVIMLPQPPPQLEETKIETEPPAGNVSESTTSKKKKKKKKQKNLLQGASQEATVTPVTSASVIPNPLQPAQSSQMKMMSESRNSPVIFVNPFEKSITNTSLEKNLIEQTFTGMSMSGIKQEVKNGTVRQSELESLCSSQLKFGPPSVQKFPVSAGPTENFVSITQIYDANNTKKDEVAKPQNPTSVVDTKNSNKVDLNATPQKSKAELKAERRAVQEAQRAAKEATKKAAGIVDNHLPLNKLTTQSKTTISPTITSHTRISKETQKVGFFSHLPQFKSSALLEKHLESDVFIHPAVIAIGAKYAKESITDPNACCIGILAALKKVIEDYKTPPNKELRRDLGSKIELSTSFIAKCRPLSVGTLNALKFLKLQICNIPINEPDDKAKKNICEQVEKFVKDSISLAIAAISELVSSVCPKH